MELPVVFVFSSFFSFCLVAANILSQIYEYYHPCLARFHHRIDRRRLSFKCPTRHYVYNEEVAVAYIPDISHNRVDSRTVHWRARKIVHVNDNTTGHGQILNNFLLVSYKLDGQN